MVHNPLGIFSFIRRSFVWKLTFIIIVVLLLSEHTWAHGDNGTKDKLSIIDAIPFKAETLLSSVYKLLLLKSCSDKYPELCKNESNCKDYNGYWYDKSCHVNEYDTKWLVKVRRWANTYTAIGLDDTIYYLSDKTTVHNGSIGDDTYLAPSLTAVNGQNGQNKWNFEFNDKLKPDGSPVIGDDGTIYFCANSFPHSSLPEEPNIKIIYAINPDGTLKWSYEKQQIGGYGDFTGITLGHDGTVYAKTEYRYGSEDKNYVYAIDKNGHLKWTWGEARLGSAQALAVDSHGNIILQIVTGTGTTRLHSLSSTGDVNWTYTSSQQPSQLLLGKDQKIYILGRLFLTCLDKDGIELWDRYHPYNEFHGGAIGDDGTVYISGRIKTDADGTYDPSVPDLLLAISPDNVLKWKHQIPALREYWVPSGYSNPAISNDGTIYVSVGLSPGWFWNIFNLLYAINPDGSISWSIYYEPDDETSIGSININSQGHLIIDGTDGSGGIYGNDHYRLRTISTKNGGPSDAPWPLRFQNSRNTSRID